jgi:long-chain acyl-CoA synthetase
LTASEEVIAQLPMAWVGDDGFSFAQSYVTGFALSARNRRRR